MPTTVFEDASEPKEWTKKPCTSVVLFTRSTSLYSVTSISLIHYLRFDTREKGIEGIWFRDYGLHLRD